MINYEKVAVGALLGIGVFALGFNIAKFAKKMVDLGKPEIAKLPIKALDEIAQKSSSHDIEKISVSFMSKIAEEEINSQNHERNWQR